jgi:hypothetical protein
MGKQGAMIRNLYKDRAAQYYIEAGMSPQEANGTIAEFGAMKRGAATLGQLDARMTAALQKAKATAPVVLDISSQIPRTDYPTLNSIYLAASKGLGGEMPVRYKIALETLASNYGTSLGMGNSVLTDFQTKRAQELLEWGYSHNQMKSAVDQMLTEIDREQTGVQRSMRTFLGGHTVYPANTPPEDRAGATAAPATPTRSPRDQQAIDWANANPTNPMAAEIKKRLGVQ